jgi:F0F1-type ATP synthase membrane subunit c/vacuolar-type H+-ATPase subunit K
MKKAKLTSLVIAIAVGFCATGSAWAEEGVIAAGRPAITEKPVVRKPLVQMAILLDTSGSMSGLINQAKAELWAIVNEFIFAKRNGIEPEIQVALFEYGKNSVPSQNGYIRKIVPLSTDLDKISEELFALQTNGGSEYCGWVIKEATESLNWSSAPDDLKVIFIAGNEPFTQGPVDYRQACKAAVSKGIIVNTIHCGSDGAGLSGKWKDGALLADGKYMNINHNRQVVHVEAPQDKQIAELGLRLNETYIAYGREGAALHERQSTQDGNAALASREAALQRAVAKASRNYRNEDWDLVDAINNSGMKLEDIKEEDLPEEIRSMSGAERNAYIEAKARQRTEIQREIEQLNEQRKKYVAAEMQKRQKDGKTLGSAVIAAVREQATKRNFSFKQSQEPKKSTKENPEK